MLYSLSRALIILFFSFFLVIGAIRIFPLFPYTTLFRSVGILENRALGVVEIVPRSGRFDYESKYTAGMTEYHWPAKDRKSTRLNSSHVAISYAVFCLKKKNHHSLFKKLDKASDNLA